MLDLLRWCLFFTFTLVIWAWMLECRQLLTMPIVKSMQLTCLLITDSVDAHNRRSSLYSLRTVSNRPRRLSPERPPYLPSPVGTLLTAFPRCSVVFLFCVLLRLVELHSLDFMADVVVAIPERIDLATGHQACFTLVRWQRRLDVDLLAVVLSVASASASMRWHHGEQILLVLHQLADRADLVLL
jgi:hypothetical protein